MVKFLDCSLVDYRTLWNQVVVNRWGPQGVFLTLPIHERTRKIVAEQIPTWTQTTCDFQRIRRGVTNTWCLQCRTYEHLYWFDILDPTDSIFFQQNIVQFDDDSDSN